MVLVRSHKVLLWATYFALSSAADIFNPNSYAKKFANCQAYERTSASPEKINLRLAYLDINPQAKKTLILVHGWPSLWTTYREQIAHFSKDYRLILPEHRGYGDSQHPRDLNSSNTFYDVSVAIRNARGVNYTNKGSSSMTSSA
jgi:soluble epoxide hydrolase/lipid-phosphate phosphatase